MQYAFCERKRTRNGIAIDMQQFSEYRVAPFFWNRVSKSYYSLALLSIVDQRINRGEISQEAKREKKVKKENGERNELNNAEQC